MAKIQIGDVFRYARPYSAEPETIDGILNHFHVTNAVGRPKVMLDSGINSIASVKAPEGERRPAIVIRSSPHKIGSEETPWQDVFDEDNGHIRYYGDNKTPGKDPGISTGNKALLEAFGTYTIPKIRYKACPLLFYKAVSRGGKSKGFVQFKGYGIIYGVKLVTQYNRKEEIYFSNYEYNLQVFSLADENEEFDWQWINDRRDPTISIEKCDRYAPTAWKNWKKDGKSALEKCRRRVSKLLTSPTSEQKPNDNEEKIIQKIYSFYHGRKHHFEGLAATVISRLLSESGMSYEEGWITPPGGDGGADFYGRIDVGQGFGKAKLIMLGQAKCEKPNTPTGGNHIARTVARLKRGWVGAYVTTSYFSESVQREIIEDNYPIILVNGAELARVVSRIIQDDAFPNVEMFLEYLDSKYENLIENRKPEELLLK